MNKTLYLLDASSYLFRAYYAVSRLTNSKGLPTNAVYGMAQMLLKFIKEFKPEYFVALFDRKEDNFRKLKYPQYKAQRGPMPEDLAIQLPYIRRLLEAFSIPVFDLAGYEADDLIATLCRRYEKEGFQIVIVTSDKDLMQLVGDQVKILDTLKNKWSASKEVLEKFGVAPNQVAYVLGLAGDTSDNIPGVPGIGPKSASELIARYGTLEGVYENLEEIKGKKQELLKQYKEQAYLSYELALLCEEAPLEVGLTDLQLKLPNQDLLKPLCQELNFNKLLLQFGFNLEPLSTSQEPVEEKDSFDYDRYELIQNSLQLKSWIEKLTLAKQISLDTETTSLNIQQAKLVGISFAIADNEACYIPLRSSQEDILNLEEVLKVLKPILENPSLQKIGQNLKYDFQIFKKVGIDLKGLSFDTMLAHYLLHPSEAHNLDALAQKYLSHQNISYLSLTQNAKITFDEVPLQEAKNYAAEDADVAYRLKGFLEKEMSEKQLNSLFYEIELPLVEVLAHMEYKGVLVSQEVLLGLQEKFGKDLIETEQKIYQIAGFQFNIQSPKQLAKVLFEDLKLPTQKKTKTGFSTDVDVLTLLSKIHPLPAQILRHRSLAKLKSTYVDALLEMRDTNTGRIHTHFNQTIAETGRLSSSDPNLQNIPIKTEEGKKIREAFIAPLNCVLLSADYSQIELRILAHFSEDAALLKAYQENADIHSQTAAKLYKVSLSEVTKEMRAMGKTVNFGVVYGQTPFGLSQQLGISPSLAKEYIDSYFNLYPGVLGLREKILEEARALQEVKTIKGRLRKIPDLLSRNPHAKAMAERLAFNTVIQGSAADLIKMAMLNIHQTFINKSLQSSLILQVHDELILEVNQEELEEVKKIVKEKMENVYPLKVPLLVEMGLGPNWANAH